MSYNLIIIDMQPYFKASFKVIDKCIEYIIKAKNDNADIYLVEYYECGNSHKEILNNLKDYKFTKIIKKSDDGACEIIKKVKNLNQKTKICGVNTSLCVYSTIVSLMEKLSKPIPNSNNFYCPNIKILKPACADIDLSKQNKAFKTLKSYYNIY